MLFFFYQVHDNIRFVLNACSNDTQKVASSRFNYVFQFIIVCPYHEQRWYIEFFFHAIKYRNEFHCGSYLFNVHTQNISLMVTNSFLCLQFYRYRLLNKFRCIICTSSFRFLFNFASVSLANYCCATCITIAGLCFPSPPSSSLLSLLTLHSPRLSPLRSILPQCVKLAYLFLGIRRELDFFVILFNYSRQWCLFWKLY